jgi:hypothetical protein
MHCISIQSSSQEQSRNKKEFAKEFGEIEKSGTK